MFEKPIYTTRPLLPDKSAMLELFSEVYDSKWLTNMGKQHQLLEQELCEHLEIDNISLINNGTLALIIALKALNLPANSEVITTPFTFAATPHSIVWAGLKPVFADIDDSMTLCPKAIEAAITPTTRAILAVHVYGFPCDVEAIDKIAKKYDLKVIYDAAHAFSTRIYGQPITDSGDITMLSFHATKLFNSIEGGALVCKSVNLQDKIYELRNFGIQKISSNKAKEGIKAGDFVNEIGINGKMNEFQAVWGRLTLRQVAEEQVLRGKIAQIYKEAFSDIPTIFIPKMPAHVTNSRQYFPVFIKGSRDEVYNILLQHNIVCRKYFYPLCSDFGCYAQLPSSAKDNLSNAHELANQVLCLPFYSEILLDESVYKICKIIRGALGENG